MRHPQRPKNVNTKTVNSVYLVNITGKFVNFLGKFNFKAQVAPEHCHKLLNIKIKLRSKAQIP